MASGAGLAQGLWAFAAYIPVVLVALRLARRTEPALVVLTSALVVCIVSVAAFVAGGQAFNLWIFLVIYWFLVSCFVMAFGAVYKSLSLRILLDLSRKPGCSDDYHRLFERYLVADSFQNRLAVIREKHLAVDDGDQLALSAQGRLLATRVAAVQRLFGITRSG